MKGECDMATRINLTKDGNVKRNGRVVESAFYKAIKIKGKRTGGYVLYVQGKAEIFESEQDLRDYCKRDSAFPMERARESAMAEMEAIRELLKGRESGETDVSTLIDNSLCSEVRSGWNVPGRHRLQAEEYNILLATGGPAVRIVGDLCEHKRAHSARLQMQDWFTPWVDVNLSEADSAALLEYAGCFCFD